MDSDQDQVYVAPSPHHCQGHLTYKHRGTRVEASQFSFNPNSNKFGTDPPHQSTPTVTMNGSEILKSDDMSATGLWTNTPIAHAVRPRPATIHEGFSYCMSEEYSALANWDSSSLPLQQTPSDTMSSRPISVHQEFYTPPASESNQWLQKPCEDTFEFHNLEGDASIGQAYTTDEAIPILDLQYQSHSSDGDTLGFEAALTKRRMSGSSFTMSTSDMASFEDFSTALSEAPSFSSDYPPPSNRNSLMSSTQLSPVASPRMTPQGRSEMVRTHTRGRASPSPRPGVRTAPYSVESARSKRWSTGSYGTAPNRRASPFIYHPGADFGAHPRLASHHSSPTIPPNPLPLNFGNLQAAQQNPFMIPTAAQSFHRNSMLLPTQLPSHAFHHPEALNQHPHHHHNPFEAPPPLLFRMLQSNADPHALHSHYTDLSDPPDLYASLHEEQVPPPPEDMNPSDPDLVPHEQELRFEGDLYTPKWVRGHGNKREGWCGICKPGRWLVLKNSAFWYDKSFTHGVSAATGSPFQEPLETRRMDGNPDVWEGLCNSCNEWIALVSSKKKGTTWFRHAYKCHTHPKIKDAPKRRRESSHGRVITVSTPTKAKPDASQQPPLTPQMTPVVVHSSGAMPMQQQVFPQAHVQPQQLQSQQLQPQQLQSQQLQPHHIQPQQFQSHQQQQILSHGIHLAPQMHLQVPRPPPQQQHMPPLVNPMDGMSGMI